jgi:hypothetical protein
MEGVMAPGEPSLPFAGEYQSVHHTGGADSISVQIAWLLPYERCSPGVARHGVYC